MCSRAGLGHELLQQHRRETEQHVDVLAPEKGALRTVMAAQEDVLTRALEHTREASPAVAGGGSLATAGAAA